MDSQIVSFKKKKQPLEVDFIAVCLNDENLNDSYRFQKGEVYEFYNKDINHQYFKKSGTNTLYEIDWSDYDRIYGFNSFVASQTPFMSFNRVQKKRRDFFVITNRDGDRDVFDSCTIPKIFKIFGLEITLIKWYDLSVDNKLIGPEKCRIFEREIKTKIIAPISFLKYENKKVASQFHNTIDYALTSLRKLCKVADIIDFQKEIDEINKLLLEYCSFATAANESYMNDKAKELNEFLDKHHSLLNSMRHGVQLIMRNDK